MLSSPAFSQYFWKVHQILHVEKLDTWHVPLSIKKIKLIKIIEFNLAIKPVLQNAFKYKKKNQQKRKLIALLMP